MNCLGKDGAKKSDEFSENYIAIFFLMDMVAYAYMQGGMRAS